MRLFLVFISLINFSLFSQQKELYSGNLIQNSIQFVTDNLDDIRIENSKTKRLEIVLDNDNSIPLSIKTVTLNHELIVSFEKENTPDFNDQVFRKYITKRLERARVIVRVPINKNVVVEGENVGVVSKSYDGDLFINIEKGNVRLGAIRGKTQVSLFLGNVYGVINSANLNLITNKGIIQINKENKVSPHFKTNKYSSSSLLVNSINANIYLTEK